MSILDKILHRKPAHTLTNGCNYANITGMSADEIKALRKVLKWNQLKFAATVNVSITTVVRWEHGYAKPNPLAVEKLQSLKARHERGEI